MRKAISIAFATLIAMGAIILVAKGILDRSTGEARTAAVATLEVKLKTIAQAHSEEVAPSGPIDARVSIKPLVPSREALRQRWSKLFEMWYERFQDQAFKEKWKTFTTLVDRTRSGPLFLDILDEADCLLLESFLEESGDILQEIDELTQPGYPALPYVDLVRNDPFYAFDRLLSGHMLLSSHVGDIPAMHGDLRALLHCSRMTFYSYPPESFMTEIPIVIDRILREGALEEVAWDETLVALSKARQHDQFVEKCAARAQGIVDWYDEMPRGSGVTLRESPVLHGLMWGYRYGLTPKMNQDMVRFSDIMGELLELAPRPYYEIEPALRTLIETRRIPEYDDLGFFDTTPTEVHLGGLVHEELWARAYTECLLDQMRLGIEIARYRHQNGGPPPSLDVLDSEIPVNVLTGEAHQYRLDGEGFALWFDFPTGDEAEIYVRLWPGRRLEAKEGDDIEGLVLEAAKGGDEE